MRNKFDLNKPVYHKSYGKMTIERYLEANLDETDTENQYDCEYGYENIVAGVPVTLGKDGFEKIVELELNEEQKAQFAKSISSIKELVDTIDKNF